MTGDYVRPMFFTRGDGLLPEEAETVFTLAIFDSPCRRRTQTRNAHRATPGSTGSSPDGHEGRLPLSEFAARPAGSEVPRVRAGRGVGSRRQRC